MKQDSPIRKKQNYVATEKHFSAIIERSTAPRRISAEAGRRAADKCDCDNPAQCWEPCGELGHNERYAKPYVEPKDSAPKPIMDAAKGLVAGAGIGASLFTMVLTALGDYGTMLWYAAIALACLFMLLWLDADE